MRSGSDRRRASRLLHLAPHLAIAKLTSWRETAEAIAAGLGEEVVEWLDSDDEDGATFIVERP